MSYQIEIKRPERTHLAAVEFTCSVEEMPKHLEEAFTAVLQYLGSAGAQPFPSAVARYRPPENGVFNVAAGFLVRSPVEGNGHVIAIELPATDTASTIHTGPYDTLPQAYNAIFDWLKEKGLEPDSVMWEEYLSPPDTPPDQTRTEIFWPVKQQ